MLDKFEVKITKQALSQMQEIVRYISKVLNAPEAATNLLFKMNKSINSLSSVPARIALVEEEPWRTKGIRKIIVENFYIYFWIDSKNKKVQVIAVIYQKRNQLEQLKNIK